MSIAARYSVLIDPLGWPSSESNDRYWRGHGSCREDQIQMTPVLLAHSTDFDIWQCSYIRHMDFYFCLPLYEQFPTTTSWLMHIYTTCSFYNHCLPCECTYHALTIYHMLLHLIYGKSELWAIILHLKGKTSEILMIICEGFTAALSKVKSFHQDPLVAEGKDHSHQGHAHHSISHAPSSSSSPPIPSGKPKSDQSGKSRSDHIVSRMKMFFQGGSFVGVSSSGGGGASGSGAKSPTKARRLVEITLLILRKYTKHIYIYIIIHKLSIFSFHLSKMKSSSSSS